MASSVERVDLDGKPIKAITICMIGAGGFIGSHLCEKLMSETPHTVLAVDVYNDKIKHLLEPDSLPWSGRIQFHRINIKNDSRLEGLIKMADLTINLAAICTPADYNTRPLDTIYSNFIDALPVVKYCSENNKRIIHFSTCEVYGKTIGSYLPKDSPLRQTKVSSSGASTTSVVPSSTGINHLAGAEAVISHLVVKNFGIPCAHAPTLSPLSLSMSLCPKSAAEEVPIITVEENETVLNDSADKLGIEAEDYFYNLPYNTGYQIFVLRLRKTRDEIIKCTLYICRYIF